MFPITKNWFELLKDEFESQEFKNLQNFLNSEYASFKIYPKVENVFTALNLVKFEDVKVVIIGQDPYHGPGQAHGLSFSVKPGVRVPPSLQNIYKEIEADIGTPQPKNNGNLVRWAKQGVLLLNAVLTVRAGQANSHSKIGWQHLTNEIIRILNNRTKPMVFLLWGAYAGQKQELITNPIHLTLKAAHPSPLSASRGLFGCKHFSKTNSFLIKSGQKPIEW